MKQFTLGVKHRLVSKKSERTGIALRIRLLFALAISFICLVPTAKATTVIPPDFSTMVHRAEVIFRGKVTNVRSEWTGEGSQRCIVSYITFDVLKTLKGKPATPYVLKMLGGTVGDQALEIPGVPKFNVGDHTLLFVEHNGTQFVPLVGIMHGYFRIQTDTKTGAETVLRYNGDPLQNTAEIDQTHQRAVASGGIAEETAQSTPGTPMKRSDFENQIEQKLTSDP